MILVIRGSIALKHILYLSKEFVNERCYRNEVKSRRSCDFIERWREVRLYVCKQSTPPYLNSLSLSCQVPHWQRALQMHRNHITIYERTLLCVVIVAWVFMIENYLITRIINKQNANTWKWLEVSTMFIIKASLVLAPHWLSPQARMSQLVSAMCDCVMFRI